MKKKAKLITMAMLPFMLMACSPDSYISPKWTYMNKMPQMAVRASSYQSLSGTFKGYQYSNAGTDYLLYEDNYDTGIKIIADDIYNSAPSDKVYLRTTKVSIDFRGALWKLSFGTSAYLTSFGFQLKKYGTTVSTSAITKDYITINNNKLARSSTTTPKISEIGYVNLNTLSEGEYDIVINEEIEVQNPDGGGPFLGWNTVDVVMNAKLIIDTQGPTFSVVGINSGKSLSEGDFINEGVRITSFEKNFDHYEYTAPGMSVQEISSSSFNLDGKDGDYTVKAFDKSGNSSTTSHFTIDRTAPLANWSVEGNEIPNNSKTNKPAKLVWSESEITAVYSKNEANLGNYFKGTTLSEDGEYRITLTDKAGNSSSYSITINSVAPAGRLYADDKEIGNDSHTNKTIRFEWDDSSYKCTLNDNEYRMNTPIKEEGIYTFVLSDSYGNSSTYTIEIDKTSPSINKEAILSEKSLLVSKFYQSEFDGNKTSFKTYEKALEHVKGLEKKKYVAELTLNDVKDFTQTHLVADNGDPNNHDDEVRTGTYWKYKSRTNPSIELYYFDINLLNDVISYYASKHVSGPIYKQQGKQPEYETIDDSMYDNSYKDTVLANSFVPKTGDSVKIVAKKNGETLEKPLQYGKTLGEQILESGVYDIIEEDEAGNKTTYQVYIDHDAPIINAKAKVFGEENEVSIKIDENSSKDIKDFFYKSFTFESFEDADKWSLMTVEDPSGVMKTYSSEDKLPSLEQGGKYVVTVYDRLENHYSFNVYIVGNPANIVFTESPDRTSLGIKINLEQDFNTLVSLEIYRDGQRLEGVSTDKLEYSFDKQGYYKVVLKDNFGRAITQEHDFEKALPNGELKGVANKGKTKEDVSFSFDKSKYYAMLYKDGKEIEKNSTGKIDIKANKETSGDYLIRLINLTDEDNYNDYYFSIDLISPSVILEGVEDKKTTNKDVKVSWKDKDVVTAKVIHDGKEESLFNGQLFTKEGTYQITLIDDMGQSSTKTFTIDKHASFDVIASDGTKLNSDGTTGQDVIIQENENLKISITKNGQPYDYEPDKPLTEEGTYVIRGEDEFKNVNEFTITIDKSALLEIDVPNGGITNQDVEIKSNENITIVVTKDGQPYDYKQGEKLTEEGDYKVVATDAFGNKKTYEFTIQKSTVQSYQKELGKDVKIISVSKDGQPFNQEGNSISLTETGTYEYVIESNGKRYSFSIVIDSTAPEITLNGVEDGGTVDGKVSISDLSEEGTVEVYKDGQKIDYEIGQELSEYGHYEVVVKDKLGNQRTYSFDLKFQMNAWATTLIVLAVISVIGGAVLLILNRKKIFKKTKETKKPKKADK